MTTYGQQRAETAKLVYQFARRQTDSLVKLGRIAAGESEAAFAKLASRDLTRYGIPLSKDMLSKLSQEVPYVDALLAKSAEKAARATVSGTVEAAVTAKTVAAAAGGALAQQTALGAARTAARGTAGVAAAFFIAESGYTLFRLARGQITSEEAGRRTARSAASNAGGVAGAAAGAAVGSVVPLIGTAIGAIVGGFAGGVLSGLAAEKLAS